MTQHLQSYSGQSYDRWVQRNSNSSTLGKVQKQFWFTKSAVIRRLGKKEDEHVVASDAELDAKIELFKAIESSTKNLQVLLADYQNKICVMAQEENALGRLLKEYGKQDRTRAGKMMTAAGKSLSYTAQQRVALRNPLVRLFQEVDTFHTRAVEDTAATVTEMEKVRTEYRGSLMWMKNISQDFNPDQYHQLEKFREVQGTVKQKKAKFDRMKLKSLQKIDLLAASRCNMFSHALIVYQNNLITFSEKTAKTLNNVATNFKGYQPYQFTVIKELADLPIQEDIQEEGRDEEREDKLDGDEKTFFNAEYHDDPRRRDNTATSRDSKKDKGREQSSDSLMNLLDCSPEEEGEGDPTLGAAPHSLDLLTSEPELPETEKDTQQMLRELFESPVRQPLPVFGSTDVAATATTAQDPTQSPGLGEIDPSDPFSLLQERGNQQPQNMFLPSQLLDFGMHGWPSTSPQASGPAPASAPTPGNQPLAPGSGWAQSRPAPANTSLKQEVQKLDWYKVFQDIDPLGDPASAIFNQATEEDKQC